MTYEQNVYYHPETWDLEVVGEVDYSSGIYEFDTRVVWKHKKTGQLYTMRDSGCSCPTPFEDYNNLEDLEAVNFDNLEAEIKSERSRSYYEGASLNECRDFLDKVAKAMLPNDVQDAETN